MNLYYAPLEGIGLRVLRCVHNEVFGNVDAYFAPFISPGDQERVNRKGMRDIAPEENKEVKPKIQVLTGNSESFLKFAEDVKSLGSKEKYTSKYPDAGSGDHLSADHRDA